MMPEGKENFAIIDLDIDFFQFKYVCILEKLIIFKVLKANFFNILNFNLQVSNFYFFLLHWQ